MAEPIEHHIVFKEAERFAGWPANNGCWIWGDEIVVGFTLGYHDNDKKSGHPIKGPSAPRQARSLDGAETWTIEVPDFLDENDQMKEAVPLKEKINFEHPGFALRFKNQDSGFSYSLDKCKTWKGPFLFPNFDRPGLLARTDYIVEGEDTLTVFLTSPKDGGNEGWPYCARTTDGGLNWEFIGWIGEQPPEGYGYAIMPSTITLKNGAYLSMIRRGGVMEDGERQWWLESFLSPDKGKSWYMLKEPWINNAGNPASMIRLQDGRIAMTYGWRSRPYGMRAILSSDEGQTWSEEIILQDEGGSWDIGYPRTVQRSDGKVVTIYYYKNKQEKERHIMATIWDPDAVVGE